MRNFGRALYLTLRFKWTIVWPHCAPSWWEFLWGVNIGTVYPLCRSSSAANRCINGLAGQIQGAESNSKLLQQKIADLKTRHSQAAGPETGRVRPAIVVLSHMLASGKRRPGAGPADAAAHPRLFAGNSLFKCCCCW